MSKIYQKLLFKLRNEFGNPSAIRRAYWRFLGLKVGSGTSIDSIEVNWPHQVTIGDNCRLESGTAFKFDGFWQLGPNILVGDRVFIGRNCEFNICERIEIGNDSLIASGCRFIDHNHGVELDTPMNVQPNTQAAIVIEEDVWIGVNSVVLKGVRIERGAIVGAGAVVTKSIGACEIWAGVPARQIGTRS